MPAQPVVISRAEDLANAIERLRPIPRGGAVIEVQSPGLGTIRVQVAVEEGVVRIRIDTDDPQARAWIEGEQRGITAAARQAAPEASSVELELRQGDGDARERPSQRSAAGGRNPDRTPTTHAAASTPAAEPITPSRAGRGLVDVIA
ncbi:MAG: hypothetical protein IAG13_21670 [Deltaproteobacteria bacterium]|nr:hypothetical protein [Nannocystaceae bacterium]